MHRTVNMLLYGGSAEMPAIQFQQLRDGMDFKIGGIRCVIGKTGIIGPNRFHPDAVRAVNVVDQIVSNINCIVRCYMERIQRCAEDARVGLVAAERA